MSLDVQMLAQFRRWLLHRHGESHNISIFVQTSNIASGCQILSTGHDPTRRLRVASFSDVIAGRRNVSFRVVAEASTTKVKHPRWQTWNENSFWVEWEKNLASCLLSHVKYLERQGADRSREVLALCTGDGEIARTVERVARRGWQVEIWCWRATCDSAYSTLAQSGHVKLCFLDYYRLQITQYGLGEPQPSQPGVRDGEPENPCMICLSAEAIFALRPCKHHVLCQSCLHQWMRDMRRKEQQMRCPLCRSEIDDIQLDD